MPDVHETPDLDSTVAVFGDRTNQVVMDALQADWACFYRIAPDYAPYGFRPAGVPGALRRAYLAAGVEVFDPLTPARLALQPRGFVTPGDLGSGQSTQRRMFMSFLSGFGARGTAEMLFRVRGVPVAGLSLIWLDSRRAEVQRSVAESLVSYIEFNLGNLASSGRSVRRGEADDCAGTSLTPREREIVSAVCTGLSNQDIAARLGIGLATVKTHLVNVFAKTGVRNRAELVCRFAGAFG